MGTLIRILVAAIALGAAVLYKNYRDLQQPKPRPNLNNNEFWGPEYALSTYKENKAILPFDISPAPELIADLKAQLTRPLNLHEPLEGTAFEYGFNSKALRNIVTYWNNKYLNKWIEHETYLKQFPHYQTEIQGLKIHFLHVRPQSKHGKKVLPLLLLHGWPGSVREFYELLPLLTTPNDLSEYVFEVVVPSLPGYGWSQAAARPGLGVAQVSIVLRNLMLRLGYKQFIVQGGDWGAMIGSNMASLFPENVNAYHSNMCTSNHPVSFVKMLAASLFPQLFIESQHQEFYRGIDSLFYHIMEEFGYAHIQATKPDTIGAALSHNPVGLAAYILEKFSTWTNPKYKSLSDGGLTKSFTLDALLDNVMIYYLTNSITTSTRLYAESFKPAQLSLNVDSTPVRAPAGCARFKNELAHATDSQLKDKFINLVHSTHHKRGGHFIALELPSELYVDFLEFIKKAFN